VGWDQLPAGARSAILLAAAAGVAVLVHALVYALLRRLARGADSVVASSLVRRSRRPVRWLVPAAVVQALLPTAALPPGVLDPLRHLIAILLIACVAWLIAGLLHVVQDVATHRYRLDAKDNLQARRIHTQLRLLRRTALFLVGFLAVATILMTFPRVRQLGTTLLASAGVIGLVIGMAARPLLANLIAGVQIALTQPIRLDDVVVLEGEWGRIEEITSTYVVVGLWDDRRLIVPLSYFHERPFQNWTRTRADLLGTVLLRVDYTVPVEEVRAELKRILDASGLWDGRAWALQVTDAGPETLELRALVSAPDSGTAWELRCHVREKLVAWVREHHPSALPRRRTIVEGAPAART